MQVQSQLSFLCHQASKITGTDIRGGPQNGPQPHIEWSPKYFSRKLPSCKNKVTRMKFSGNVCRMISIKIKYSIIWENRNCCNYCVSTRIYIKLLENELGLNELVEINEIKEIGKSHIKLIKNLAIFLFLPLLPQSRLSPKRKKCHGGDCIKLKQWYHTGVLDGTVRVLLFNKRKSFEDT